MIVKLTIPAVIAASSLMFSCSAQKGDAKLSTDNDSLSYALGVTIGENFKKSGLNEVDYAIVMKGIQEHLAAKGQMDAVAADTYVRGYMKKLDDVKKEAAKKDGEAYLEKNKSNPGVVTTASGLQYKVTQEGSGLQPDENDKVTVHYHGTLIDGTPFDSSVERGQPATFGLNQVIPGWTEGLQTMKEGGKTTFYIPQSLAYGARATGKIPGFSTLIFEVELIKVEPVQ
ncbi:MAG: FKBP-type peptidyl-prolyl cis-trans isomerase [Flavobacteriales bacterium]|nr:FKBP-type peptidyl-prolyl cis-trans isomerase [Flavobacteriales bacterium]